MSTMLSAPVDKLWTMFKNHLSDLMNAHIPAKTLKGTRRKKPWIDRKVIQESGQQFYMPLKYNNQIIGQLRECPLLKYQRSGRGAKM